MRWELIDDRERAERLLFGMGFAAVLLFWKWLIAAAVVLAVVAAVWWTVVCVRRERWERERAEAELVARAWAQHQLVMQGDPKGTYGE